MNTTRFWTEGILAGVCISVGGYAYVSAGGIVGAVLFAFGLITIVLSKYKLFTGMIGFCENGRDVRRAYAGLLANMLGCGIVGLGLGGIRADNLIVIDNIIEARLALYDKPLYVIALAIACGFIMTIAVRYARKGQFLPLVFGIPLFITCGFLHCVADMFYYFADIKLVAAHCQEILVVWLITILGNTIGCNIPNLIKDRV